ncbi:amidase signature enzyme [Apiospora marii]|uniref:Amidase signature enzyme n=1 Tax=Apiospora marii TaxID=335849 RepID=A0ABR1RV54_9PEZI
MEYPQPPFYVLAEDNMSLPSTHQHQYIPIEQEYAESIREFSRISSFQSLYSGQRFAALANFLGRPYERRAATLDSRAMTAVPRREACSFVMILNWQGESDKRVQQFHAVDQLHTVEKLAGSVVVIKGYPTAEWLNTLGAKYRIDPDFYQRHLCFWSESGSNISRQNIAPRLPSAQEESVMLRIATIGVLTGKTRTAHGGGAQKRLDDLRRQTSKDMAAYISRLSSLNSPDMILGDSIVREFVMLDLDHFAIEQMISINISPSSNGGWRSTVWSDAGRNLQEGLEGPWRPVSHKYEQSDMFFLPISIFKPRMALKAAARNRKGAAFSHVGLQSSSILFEEYQRELDSTRAAIDPLYALSPIFRFYLFSNMALLDIIESNMRSELTHSAVTAQESPTMSNLLYNKQILKRHIDSLNEVISFTERFRKHPSYQSIEGDLKGKSTGEVASVLDDLHAALQRAESLCDECYQGMGIVAHNATIQEAQKAFAEARSVTKLTKLALVFVPLSFTTSAFGMNIKELGAAGAPSIWLWLVVTIGVGIPVLAFFQWDVAQLQSFVGALCFWSRTRSRTSHNDLKVPDVAEQTLLFQVDGNSYAAFKGIKFYPRKKAIASSLVTVIASPPGHSVADIKDWVKPTIQHFEECDDVFRPEFLEGLIVISTSQKDKFWEPRNCYLLGPKVRTSWVHVTRSRSHYQLKPGPYYLHNGYLWPVSRLYEDTQKCFLATFKPTISIGDGFTQLPVSGATEFETQGVAIPSRIGVPEDVNKLGLSQKRIAVKDVYRLRGMRTSLCNKDYYRLSRPSGETAMAVQLLADAGCQIVGLTKLSSMIAREEPSEAVDFPTAFNPRGDGYQSPAGSSSGSAAAVASYDWIDCALGTDTSGSGRRPALVNGVYQFRPTQSDHLLKGMVPTFGRFDSPCIFGRNLTILESVLRAWHTPKQTSLAPFGKTFQVIYPLDFFPVRNPDQMRIIKEFLDDMTTYLPVQLNCISIAETWRMSPPEGIKDELSDYLRDVIVNTYYHDFYHSTEEFRDEFYQEFNRCPYVIPFVRERWHAGDSVRREEYESGLDKLNIYRNWLLQRFFQQKQTLMALPISNVEPNYRDIASKSPAILEDTDQLYLPPILGSPDIVLPIGEVEYLSRITKRYEHLPVAINLVAAPGEDFWLLNAARQTLKMSGRREEICTGPRIFQESPKVASRTFTLSSDSTYDESVVKA